MISKEAISYDRRQLSSLVLSGKRKEALAQIENLVLNLELLLHPPTSSRGKSEPQTCAADEFGRENVRTLRSFCYDVATELRSGQGAGAVAAVAKTQEFWGSVIHSGR